MTTKTKTKNKQPCKTQLVINDINNIPTEVLQELITKRHSIAAADIKVLREIVSNQDKEIRFLRQRLAHVTDSLNSIQKIAGK